MNNLTALIEKATEEYNEMVDNSTIVTFDNYVKKILRRKQDKYYQTANEINMLIGWKALKDNPHEHELEFITKQ